MINFEFINLSECPVEDSIFLNDLYFEAKIIDSPKDYYKNLIPEEQNEILNFYQSGNFFKIQYENNVIGFIDHGIKLKDAVMIFYIFTPFYRGKGLFQPMIDQFSKWCKNQYPEKKFLRANTEASNLPSIAALKKAGFIFYEEKMDGPEDHLQTLFYCFIRNL